MLIRLKRKLILVDRWRLVMWSGVWMRPVIPQWYTDELFLVDFKLGYMITFSITWVYFIRFRVLLSYTFVYSVESRLYYFHTFCRIFVYWWLYRLLNRVSSVIIRYFSNVDLILPDVANPLLTSTSFFWPLWPEWAAPFVFLHLHHFLLCCFLSA